MENPITFHPRPRSSRKYGVSIKYFDEDLQAPSKRVDFQVTLGIEQYKNEERVWQLSIDRTELFINRHEPDLISEQLAALAMQALYPIKVDVNHRNQIFRGIANHGDILQRWASISEKIADKYAGDYSELFIRKMSDNISNASEIERALGFDMFWSVFFHPQYLNYDAELGQDIDFYFPILPYKKMRFQGRQILETEYTEYGTYAVNFSSVQELPDEIKWKDRNARMRLDARFDLEGNGGLMKNAVVNWGIFNKDGRSAGRSIQFSAYGINTAADQGAQQTLVSAEEPAASQKKGFWERILG